MFDSNLRCSHGLTVSFTHLGDARRVSVCHEHSCHVSVVVCLQLETLSSFIE